MEDKYTDYVIIGEIYLKMGPEVFMTSQKIEKISDVISDIEFDISKENPDFSRFNLLEKYKELEEMIKQSEGKIDYSGTSEFWQVTNVENNIISLEECNVGPPVIKKYVNINKLRQNYVKLSHFLEKATFVGREFKRTTHILSNSGRKDMSYMFTRGREKYVVLYATKDLFLIKITLYDGTEKYKLINSRYTLDGNYEFYGPVYEEYRDKNKVYQEIFTQIKKVNKNKRRK